MPDSPNILLILCDQMRPFELGCFGGPGPRTPNLDALAGESVVFEQAFSNNALCSPARSCLLSGQYCRTCNGQLHNVGEPESHRKMLPGPTLPEVLARAGYRTGLSGKWHVQPHPELLGLQEYLFPSAWHRNTHQRYFDDTGGQFVHEGFGPDLELRWSGRFLGEDDPRPFFLMHSICLPHMPFMDVPARWRDRYGAGEVCLRENVRLDGREAYDEHWFKVYLHDYLYYRLRGNYALPEGFGLRELTAMYWGMIACVDWQVGRLLSALEETGRADDTLVIFLSDHGEMLGSHHRFNKGCNDEEAVRIPMFFRGPGLSPCRVSGQVASLIDVLPSLASLAGLDVPPGVQGADLSPVIRGEAEAVGGNEAFLEGADGDLSIRTPSHKYTVSTTNQAVDLMLKGHPLPAGGAERRVLEGGETLFDLREDPLETRNLLEGSTAETAGGIAAELRQRLLAWDRQTPWLEHPPVAETADNGFRG